MDFSRKYHLTFIVRFLLGASILVQCFVPIVQAKTKGAAGLELGGNGTLLTSDPTVGMFGVGAGYQGSVFARAWDDRPLALKLRYEILAMKEGAIQKTQTDYIVPSTYLKTAAQNWNVLSAGIEGHFEMQGQIFFWEALLGYAFSQNSTVTLTAASADQAPFDTTQMTSSGFTLGGGVGIKKSFSKVFTGLMTVRTMFFIGPAYSSDALADKAIIPVPLIFNVGGEFPFEF